MTRYTRILGELRKLGIDVSHQTVKNILKVYGLDPGPKHGKGTWDEFLKIHLLIFIHVCSPKVWISSPAVHPDSAWIAQQMRNFSMDVADGPENAMYVLHDADTKFAQQFREILKSDGMTPKRTSPVSPNLNAFVERYIQTLGQECVNHFVVLGERHLDRIVLSFVRYYHEPRPHQSLDDRPDRRSDDWPIADCLPGVVGRTSQALRAVCGPNRLGVELSVICRADSLCAESLYGPRTPANSP